MIHPASHCPLLVMSRSDGRSAVAAAAYAARTKMTDLRTGFSYNYRYTPGLLKEGLVNWRCSAEQLWNAAEKSEKRINSRVARELRPGLPAELPLDEQHRLVHGFACWLKDQFGVAVHWVIHAPTFHEKVESKSLWQGRMTDFGKKKYLAALVDPMVTNLNFHAHIRFTTRRVDGATGEFLEKTRVLDDKKVGGECVMKIRAEWEKRTNAALERAGSEARIDLRSYVSMAIAGDAPSGLAAQKHLGPRQTARIRRAGTDPTVLPPHAAIEREATRNQNQERWICWLEIRQLERAKARAKIAAKLAANREHARRKRALEEKRRITEAETAEDQRNAIDAATSIDRFGTGNDALAEALNWARSGGETAENSSPADQVRCRPAQSSPDGFASPTDDFDKEIDPETFILPHAEDRPYRFQRIKRKSRRGFDQRVRER